MKKKPLLFLLPGVFLYAVLFLLPFTWNGNLWRGIFEDNFRVFRWTTSDPSFLLARSAVIITGWNFLFQVALSFCLFFVMLKFQEYKLLAKVFLVSSFVPIAASIFLFQKFAQFVLGEGGFVEAFPPIHFIREFLSKEFVSQIFAAMFFSVQWVGLYALFFYLEMKDIPQNYLKRLQADGLNWMRRGLYLIKNYLGSSLYILGIGVVFSSFNIWGGNLSFHLIFPSPQKNLFTFGVQSYLNQDGKNFIVAMAISTFLLMAIFGIFYIFTFITKRVIRKEQV